MTYIGINYNSVGIITDLIKIIFISVCTYHTSLRIVNINNTFRKRIIPYILLILLSIVSVIIKHKLNFLIYMVIWDLLMSFPFILSSKYKLSHGILITTISLSFNYVLFISTILITFIINSILKINNNFVNLMIMELFHIIFLIRIFKIKKFKYGIIAFQKSNEYVEILIINICVSILFSIIVFSNIDLVISRKLFIAFTVLIVVMFITIQKSLQLYYKQKMLIKELDETKEDLARAENKIKILEKENIEESKKRHTIIHKQKSIEYKLEEMLTKTEMSTEEAAEVRERLEKLNKEIYTEKEVMELDKTGISSIDDMLKYMQSECVKNKIDFTLQIKGNIHYMVHNLVKEEELETLLADHIKDAIIAINHTDNANRSILVRLGNIDDIYSLYIYDSGVEFKPEVLENLGKKPCTTYANEGGTGMGFMNTFDTVRKHKASLIIEEIGKPVKDNYTKVIIIKFDKKNEFKVKSYHEIEKV